MTRTQKTGRPIFGWAAVITSFALIALTVVLFGMAQGQSGGNADRARLIDEAQLMDTRLTLELASLDVVVVRMLDGAGVDGDRTEQLESSAAEVRTAIATIVELAEGDSSVAGEAAALLDEITLEEVDNAVEGDLEEVLYVAEEVARYVGVSEVIASRREAIQQLSFVLTLPAYVLIEGIAAEVTVGEQSVDPSISEFFDMMIEVVQTEGGWFGADATVPLDNSEWIKIDDARETLPAEFARVTEIIAASPLVEYDAWMRNLDDVIVAPFDTTSAVTLAGELRAELAPVIDELISSENTAQQNAVAEQESDQRMLFAVTAAAGLLALVALLVGVLMISRSTRSSRERAEMAMRDALTLVGNRHELDDRTRVLTVDARFDHHLVVMIDLDRFKMVNDVHGHAAGDAVLVEIASRLKQVANQESGDEPETESSVIRLGGDEFLLTVHSAQPLDVERITAGLDVIRGDAIDYNGERIELGFSIGLIEAQGQNDLSDLMSAADLAVYDDKAARADKRMAAPAGFPPPRPDLDSADGASSL